MEDGQAVASSYVEAASIVGKGEAGGSLPANVSEYHGDGLSDDVSWCADSDEEADGASYLDREWKKRHEHFYNTGYRDGISAGRNDAAQDGFNHGFKDSVLVGYKWGIVRGVTSALAHIPNELKMKLVQSDDVRREFMNLHEAVDSIGTQDALKLFYGDIQGMKSAEHSRSVESGSSLVHQSGSKHSGLENYFGKLEALLEQSPVVDVHLELNQNRSSG